MARSALDSSRALLIIGLSSLKGMAPSIIFPLCRNPLECPSTKVGVARIPLSSASEMLMLTALVIFLFLLQASSLVLEIPVLAMIATGP